MGSASMIYCEHAGTGCGGLDDGRPRKMEEKTVNARK